MDVIFPKLDNLVRLAGAVVPSAIILIHRGLECVRRRQIQRLVVSRPGVVACLSKIGRLFVRYQTSEAGHALLLGGYAGSFLLQPAQLGFRGATIRFDLLEVSRPTLCEIRRRNGNANELLFIPGPRPKSRQRRFQPGLRVRDAFLFRFQFGFRLAPPRFLNRRFQFAGAVCGLGHYRTGILFKLAERFFSFAVFRGGAFDLAHEAERFRGIFVDDFKIRRRKRIALGVAVTIQSQIFQRLLQLEIKLPLFGKPLRKVVGRGPPARRRNFELVHPQVASEDRVVGQNLVQFSIEALNAVPSGYAF